MRVMVLGGGNCQLNLIKRLKSDGDYVILIDYIKDCPGRLYSDKNLLISTFDNDKVLEAAKENEIDAIVTLGTDQPIYTSAFVSEKMKLNFYLDSIKALSATNKRVMKNLFDINNIPNVKYKLIAKDFKDSEIEDIRLPVVLKPVDSQGQRGIFKLNSISEVRDNIDTSLHYSRENKVLLEEYYENDEITVNGYLLNDNFTLLSVVDRVTMVNENHIGICLAHNFPSLHLKKYYNEIVNMTNKIIKTFKFKDGPVYFQYLIGKEGIKVNEIAMRIGGAYEDITIPIITDIDILGLLLDSVKGNKIDKNKLSGYNLKDNKNYVSTQMFFLRQGTVCDISPIEKIRKLQGVKDVFYNISIGDNIGNIHDATARAGYVIVCGESFLDMLDNINNVFENLKVLDENGKNLVIKYKEYINKYKFVK